MIEAAQCDGSDGADGDGATILRGWWRSRIHSSRHAGGGVDDLPVQETISHRQGSVQHRAECQLRIGRNARSAPMGAPRWRRGGRGLGSGDGRAYPRKRFCRLGARWYQRASRRKRCTFHRVLAHAPGATPVVAIRRRGGRGGEEGGCGDMLPDVAVLRPGRVRVFSGQLALRSPKHCAADAFLAVH